MEEDVPSIDLESYVASYSGHARIQRLIYLADKTHGHQIELDALRMAHDEVKKTENLALYQTIIEKIGGRLGQEYALDRAWVTSVERSCQQKQDRLESELNSAKASLIKESIRLGHQELGDYFYNRGDLQNAYKCHVRVRDYCTAPRHILAMCLSVIRVNVELGNYWNVANYVAKAENTAEYQSDPVLVAKLSAASGLSMLASKRYKQAARKLLEVTGDLGAHFNDVLAMQDVALYAALCALATFDRDELHKKLIKNLTFKDLLDTVPEVREIAHHFYSCRYAQALSALSALSPSFAYDPHIEPHLQSLMQQIRQRALIQYTSPFSSVRLSTMAQAFNTSAAALGKELSQLIMDGHVHARIDAHAGVLHARRADARVTTFAKALALSQQYVSETKAALLRVDLIAHDFVQKPRGGGRGGGGGGGLGGDMLPGRGMDIMDLRGGAFGFGGGGGGGMSRMARGARGPSGGGGAAQRMAAGLIRGDEDDDESYINMAGAGPGMRGGFGRPFA